MAAKPSGVRCGRTIGYEEGWMEAECDWGRVCGCGSHTIRLVVTGQIQWSVGSLHDRENSVARY